MKGPTYSKDHQRLGWMVHNLDTLDNVYDLVWNAICAEKEFLIRDKNHETVAEALTMLADTHKLIDRIKERLEKGREEDCKL